MGTYNSAVITNGGQSMIAQAVAGASLEFTTIKTSNYAYPAGTNLATLTTINGINQSKDITSATVYNSRAIKISAAVDNTGISTAYTINTIGIYAKVGSSAESLFAVVTASAADTMPAYDSKPYSYIYEINLTMQNAANVTVTVNAAGLVNVADLNAAKVEIQGEIADLKSAIDSAFSDGFDVVQEKTMVIGSLSTSDGVTVQSGYTTRLCTSAKLSYDRDLFIVPEPGYRIFVFTFPNGTMVSNGWYKVPFKIAKDVEFTFIASKYPEEVVSNIPEFLTHIHITTQISNNTDDLWNLNDLSFALSNLGNIYTFNDWVQGGYNRYGWYDDPNRICTGKYHRFNDGIISIKCNSGFAPWCFVYDESKNFVNGYGDNANSSLIVNTENGYYYRFFVYNSSAIFPSTDTGFMCEYQTTLTLKLKENPLCVNWTIGNIQEGRTNITATTVANEEAFIYVRAGDIVKNNSSTSYAIKVVKYDSTRAWSNNDSGWLNLPYTFTDNGYVRLAIRTSNWAAIDDAILIDLDANVVICKSMFTETSDANAKIASVYGKHYATNGNWTNGISDLQLEQGNKFTFAVQTDTHFSTKYQGENSITPLKVLSNSVGFDFIVNLGDLIRGYQSDTLPEARESMTEAVRRYMENVGCPVLLTVGNHDNNVLWSVTNGTSSLNECILKNELTAKIIKPIMARTTIVRNGDSQYYFKDFDDVRVIVLNTRDIAYSAVASGDLDTNAHVISTGQCTWFSTVALNTDKQVIVMCHAPLVSEVSVDNIIPENASVVLNAISTFVAGGGVVIGCMYGHTHRQALAVVNGITHITFADGGYFSEVVMVDTTAKTVSTKLIGNYTSDLNSRSYSY